MMDRRKFLAGAAALAAAPALVRAADASYYGGLNVGMHTYTLRKFTFEQSVEMTKALGLKYYGFNPKHISLTSTPAKIAEARKRIEDAGLTIMAVGVVGFREKGPETRKVFDFAKLMGCKVISAAPEVAALDELEKFVVEYDIKIAIHNHGPKDRWPTAQALFDNIKDRHGNIGVCVDVGHYMRAGVQPHDAYRLLGARVFDTHLKDVTKAEESGTPVPIGQGVINFKELFKALKEIKFQGNAAIEFEADVADPMPGITQSLEHIRKTLAEI